MKGRNKYKKPCAVCGITVEVYEGYLKKEGTKWLVLHPHCKGGELQPEKKSSKRKSSSKVKDTFERDDILETLEAKLLQRGLNGEPIDMLPKIINYIKDLKAQIAGLSR